MHVLIVILLLTVAVQDPITPEPRCAHRQAKLLASDGETKDNFGFGIGAFEDIVVVGAPGDDDVAVDAGAAYVFGRSGSQWLEQQKLVASNGRADDSFGRALSIYGDTIAIGAFLRDDVFANSGATYLFDFDGQTWVGVQELLNPTFEDEAWFGYSVALHESTLIVGAPEGGPAVGNTGGQAFIYERIGPTWLLRAMLQGSDTVPYDQFGWSVAVRGDTAVVGANVHSPAGLSGAGAVYVFERLGGTWQETGKLGPVALADFDKFGESVALLDEVMFIGAPRVGVHTTGAAWVFQRIGGQWSETSQLLPSDSEQADLFGWKLHADEDLVAIGAANGGNQFAGKAYVFESGAAGTGWHQIARIEQPDPAVNDTFSISLAVSRRSIAVGVREDDDLGSNSGSAYVFRVPEGSGGPEVYCTAKLNSCGSFPSIGAVGGPSATIESGFEVLVGQARAGQPGLLLHTDLGRAAIPFDGGLLCVHPTGVQRTVALLETTGTPGDCDGVLTIDMNAFAHGTLGGNPAPWLRDPGRRIQAQFWARDTVAHGALLSDALEWVVCP